MADHSLFNQQLLNYRLEEFALEWEEEREIKNIFTIYLIFLVYNSSYSRLVHRQLTKGFKTFYAQLRELARIRSLALDARFDARERASRARLSRERENCERVSIAKDVRRKMSARDSRESLNAREIKIRLFKQLFVSHLKSYGLTLRKLMSFVKMRLHFLERLKKQIHYFDFERLAFDQFKFELGLIVMFKDLDF